MNTPEHPQTSRVAEPAFVYGQQANVGRTIFNNAQIELLDAMASVNSEEFTDGTQACHQ